MCKAAVVMMAALAAELASTACAQDEAVAAKLDPAAAPLIEANNRFALDLYLKTVPGDANLFVSPASVSAALGLAYRGARGRTAAELRALLHLTLLPDAYLPADAQVLRSLDLIGRGRELRVSNALWMQEGLRLDPGFAKDMARYAGAGLQRVDYRHDPGAARVTINRWVADRTHERIKDLLQPDDVNDDTRIILVNALYWKGEWASPFAAEATRTEPFTALSGRPTPMPLMHQQARFRVAEAAGVKAIELPYVFGEIAMVVLLPNNPKSLPQMEHALDDAGLARWLRRLDAAEPRETVLTFPKLHLAWRDDLVPTFKQLGASTPFDGSADFTGMAVLGEPGTLALGKVIHQTFLDVDEDGSEAAAATAVTGIVVTAARVNPVKPFVFRADMPFMFLLRDRRTGLILFMGRYVGPAES